ncbi:MAG: ATP-binding protein [Haloarculaceae archaeon]
MISAHQGRIRVLHVAADADRRDATAAGLERADERLEVVTAAETATALKVLDEESIDCVLADDDLQGRSATAFLEAVREENDDLPFVLRSVAGTVTAEAAIAAGASDYTRHSPGGDQYPALTNRIGALVDHRWMARELSSRKQELAERTQTLRAVYTASPLPIVVVACDGTVEFWNAAAERVFGWSESEVIGRPLPIVPDEKEDEFRRIRSRVLSGESITGIKIERETKSGERLELNLSTAPIYDSDGEVSNIMAVLSEVSDREHTLEQLHEATRSLLRAETRQEVAELTVEAISQTLGYENNCVRLLNDDGELRVAAYSSKVFGASSRVYEPGEGTVGRAFATGETLLYDDVSELDDGFDRGELRSGMYVPIGDHGTISISNTTAGVFDESDVHLAEIFAANAETAMDLVEQTYRLERQNERLETFASIVSHDLRNPLNVVAGSLQLAEETGEPEHFERATDALDRMEELIDDLLSLARTHENVSECEPVRLENVVTRSWHHVDTSDATLKSSTDRAVTADESRLQQLLENLFRNALEHGSTDSGPVTVTVGDLDDGFYVEDDGPGIPPDERECVFESGFSTAESGTGLGLAIVERIVDGHGWTISVTDGDDGGARFEIRTGEGESGPR